MIRKIISHIQKIIGALYVVRLPISERLQDHRCNDGKKETNSMDLLPAEDSNQGNFKFLRGCSRQKIQ